MLNSNGETNALFEEVHILAYYYHWGEEKILALSHKRRKMYVELVRKQVRAENGEDDEEGLLS